MKRLFSILLIAGLFTSVNAQTEPPKNWFNLDQGIDNYPGMSVDNTYKTLLNGKIPQKVIVAVIDGGVDPLHEDLKNVMWKNPREIPGNNIDDDRNGYIDDIYGWNFIGGRDGKNVSKDNLEITRLVRAYKAKFANVDPTKLKGDEKKLYDKYIVMEKDVTKERTQAENSVKQYIEMRSNLVNAETKIKTYLNKDVITQEQLDLIKNTDSPELKEAITIVGQALKNGYSSEDLQQGIDFFKSKSEYQYSLDFDPRSIVGDKYLKIDEKFYGNPDIKGPDAFHGTHVAGIIGAERGNNLGIEGVANNAIIMGVRCVPDGDERDKDVANSIRYAVDNGAKVINMSFGKSYSWNKKAVDEAVKYAASKDVLLVHAAGNDGKNNDTSDNFPNDTYEKSGMFKSKQAKNWVEVGALSYKTGEDAAARFSNYGKKNVDVFAPGVAIYSTTPDGNYGDAQGTSMAAPMVAGVAVMLRGYYPTLSAEQVKEILMKSSTKNNAKVKKPGSSELVPFSSLSASGGAVNVAEAIRLASKTKGKNKMKAAGADGPLGTSGKSKT